MDERLQALLEYDGILGALASTPDGLVVGAAGFNMSDAEIVAAAGTSLLSWLEASDERGGSIEVDSGRVHMMRGDEIVIVLLTETTIEFDSVAPLMEETLESVVGVLS